MPKTPLFAAPAPWLRAATVLGSGHAAFSLLWAFGATWMLSTLGGSLEDMARDGSVWVRLGLVPVAAMKLLLVALTWCAVTGRGGRLFAVGAWVGGVILVLYGGTLTVVETLALAGAFGAPDDAGLYALKWHAYFWDPWFLLWGICILTALALSRRGLVRP